MSKKKCKVMKIARSFPASYYLYTLSRVPLEYVDQHRLLGVHITSDSFKFMAPRVHLEKSARLLLSSEKDGLPVLGPAQHDHWPPSMEPYNGGEPTKFRSLHLWPPDADTAPEKQHVSANAPAAHRSGVFFKKWHHRL
jgi:hypothetical protein